jgi:hypothetical protein
MKTKFATIVSVSISAWIIVLCTVSSAGQSIPAINNSHDPYEVYGGCASNYSGFFSKAPEAAGIASSLANVTAIDVLACGPFDGGGGGHEVPCPSGSPYTHCVEVHNDGLANHVLVGILEVTADNNPLGEYGGCASGAGSRAKAKLLREARTPLRNVDNIVVIDCHAADGAGGTTIVPCPAGPNPYSLCLQNHDDGLGNSVLVGIVESYGGGDPNSLYGDCYTNTGFRSKASLVREAGKSPDEVVAINMLVCAPSFGAPRQVPQVVSCDTVTGLPKTYNYCLHTGSDGKGNAVGIGVITTTH